MTAILGISALYHDSAAALLVDGRIVAAAQEERFSRLKHDASFPAHAIRDCLEQAGLGPGQLDYVGFYDKPFLKFERLIETYLSFPGQGYRSFSKAIPAWLKRKQFVAREIDRVLDHAVDSRYVFTEHHEAHAASAFFPSPFEAAAILTLDGVGEWATATWGSGRGHRIELDQELHFPHSLGLLYSAFTYFTGFRVNSGEYKMMGLAPYGEPTYRSLILDHLLDLKDDGSFRLDLSFFDYCCGLTMTSKKLDRLLGGPPRAPEAPITRREMDIAASIQKVTEEIILRAARHLHAETGLPNLCLAGGVALNCVANGRLLREGPFDNVWIQPAAGDAGGALGVSTFIWHQLLGNRRPAVPGDAQRGSRLGAEYSEEAIEAFLVATGATFERSGDTEELCDAVAEDLAAGKVVGWFQERMEFGPRALGARSILGDARHPQMQSIINRKVKFREGFRPFAPIVLHDHAHEYFQLEPGQESPYMLVVAPVRDDQRLPLAPVDAAARGMDQLHLERSVIPAVTHVDYSARIQTVDPQRHGLLHQLMARFHAITGCPVLVNTSFNLGWDPIVRTPEDAYRTFMSCDMDVLCMGRFVLRKTQQSATVHQVAGDTSDEVLAGKLASPCCGEVMARDGECWTCGACGHGFPIVDDVPQLYWPHDGAVEAGDVTERIKAFYERTPFPDYDDHDSVRSLIDKSRRGVYARRLEESIPYNSDVLEMGCGTGQLANYLGISHRRVIGADLCLNSLALAEAFRKQHGLSRVRFLQSNLFRPPFLAEQFDVVICSGVLHHTSDPRGGFEALVALLKPGGHLVIGLYHRYGRLLTDLRRWLFRATGGRARWLDPVLRRSGLSGKKRRAWFEDQYRNPHESKHTVAEIVGWFEDADIQLVRGIPALRPEDDGLAGTSLFEAQPRGTALENRIVQWTQTLAAGQKEGGLFIMIGKKPGGPAAVATGAAARALSHAEPALREVPISS